MTYCGSRLVKNKHRESDTMQRLIMFLILLISLIIYTPDQLSAVDEQESLALLVQTLDTIEDPAVQTALLQGMLNGLDGRRNVPCLLYTSPSPRDQRGSRMPSSA